MKHVYQLVKIGLLIWIGIQLSWVLTSLQDWRPVRTTHKYYSYDVASVENLAICDRMAE